MSPHAVLLLHGAGGGGWEWNAWRGVLEAAGMAVATPDLLPSAAGLAATGLSDYVAQGSSALRALPRPRAVVGASFGGLVALAMAGEADAPMDALVLINPLPPSPWHALLPSRDWPGVVPWRCEARLAGTRAAVPDADDASALCAFRGWRDESGAALRAAYAGVEVAPPALPLLCIASEDDADVPAAATVALASAWKADLWRLPRASHAGPLLGRDAPALAGRVARWLSPR